MVVVVVVVVVKGKEFHFPPCRILPVFLFFTAGHTGGGENKNLSSSFNEFPFFPSFLDSFIDCIPPDEREDWERNERWWQLSVVWKMEKSRKYTEGSLFSFSRVLLCHFVLLSYPTQLKFPADVCVCLLGAAAAAAAAAPFLFFQKLFLLYFPYPTPPRASSVSRSAPSRTTKPREKNTHA